MFYDEFIKLCNSIDKSPTAVAKEIGLAGAHVTKWKKGSNPTDATKFKVCEYFGLPNDYFFYEKSNGPTTDISDDADLKAAFWGGDQDLPPEALDELWADVREYAQYKAEQWRKKQGK